jgi:predicted transposase YdaD
MLDLGQFKKSRLYQSVLRNTKLEVVPMLLSAGYSIQQIAERLELDVEEVREVAQEQ